MVDGITDSVDISLSKLREIVKGTEAWGPLGGKEQNTTQQMNTNCYKLSQRFPRTFLAPAHGTSYPRICPFAELHGYPSPGENPHSSHSAEAAISQNMLPGLCVFLVSACKVLNLDDILQKYAQCHALCETCQIMPLPGPSLSPLCFLRISTHPPVTHITPHCSHGDGKLQGMYFILNLQCWVLLKIMEVSTEWGEGWCTLTLFSL